jgi:hypothetical protein
VAQIVSVQAGSVTQAQTELIESETEITTTKENVSEQKMASLNLVNYDAARTALAKAVRVDEVKDIRDKAAAMQAYAKQAKDRELIGYATEIRMRAERRAGQLLAEMAEKKERHTGKAAKGSRVATPSKQPKLADICVTKSQFSRWQKLADKSEKDFEAVVETAKTKSVASTEKVSTTADKKAARTVREKELGKKQKSLPDQKFGVVLADPEWKFEVYSDGSYAARRSERDECMGLRIQEPLHLE